MRYRMHERAKEMELLGRVARLVQCGSIFVFFAIVSISQLVHAEQGDGRPGMQLDKRFLAGTDSPRRSEPPNGGERSFKPREPQDGSQFASPRGPQRGPQNEPGTVPPSYAPQQGQRFSPAPPNDDAQRSARLNREERRALRQQIHEVGRVIYQPGSAKPGNQ